MNDAIAKEVVAIVRGAQGGGILRNILTPMKGALKLHLNTAELTATAQALDALIKKNNPEGGVRVLDVERCTTLQELTNMVREAIDG